MQAVITQVIPPGHEHSTEPEHDMVAVTVTVSPGLTVPTTLILPTGRYNVGDRIEVCFADPAHESKGFRVAA